MQHVQVKMRNLSAERKTLTIDSDIIILERKNQNIPTYYVRLIDRVNASVCPVAHFPLLLCSLPVYAPKSSKIFNIFFTAASEYCSVVCPSVFIRCCPTKISANNYCCENNRIGQTGRPATYEVLAATRLEDTSRGPPSWHGKPTHTKLIQESLRAAGQRIKWTKNYT